jgi:hypothetical protein
VKVVVKGPQLMKVYPSVVAMLALFLNEFRMSTRRLLTRKGVEMKRRNDFDSV